MQNRIQSVRNGSGRRALFSQTCPGNRWCLPPIPWPFGVQEGVSFLRRGSRSVGVRDPGRISLCIVRVGDPPARTKRGAKVAASSFASHFF